MVNGQRALLLDLDGCIVDSLPSIARCWAEALTEFGFPAPTAAEIRPHLGPPADVVARRFARGADQDTVNAVLAAYRLRSREATDMRPYDGMPEVIAELTARGVRLALATSKSLDVVRPLLDRLELHQSFAVVEGTRVGELGADKATVVGRLLERLGRLRPTALVGDRKQDVDGAHAHGLRAIGAVWGYGTYEELLKAGVDVLAYTPSDLLSISDITGRPCG